MRDKFQIEHARARNGGYLEVKKAALVLLALILVGNLIANPSPVMAVEKKKITNTLTVASIALGLVSLFGGPIIWGALGVSAAIHAFAIDNSNDITVSTYSPDGNCGQTVSPSNLVLTREVTDYPEFPNSVNEMQNIAINSQLYHASLLYAASTATNRYYTALHYGDVASAEMQLHDIQVFVSEADLTEDVAAQKFEDFAVELQNTGSDIVTSDEATFIDFQGNLSMYGFSEDTLDIFDILITNIDPILLAETSPINDCKNRLLSFEYDDVPPCLSQGSVEAAGCIRLISDVIGPFPRVEVGVGGFVIPMDKFVLLAPYIGLVSTILVATAATAIYVKRVKRRKEKQ